MWGLPYDTVVMILVIAGTVVINVFSIGLMIKKSDKTDREG
jgi:hypothetical protein